jgi:hypothetical protein
MSLEVIKQKLIQVEKLASTCYVSLLKLTNEVKTKQNKLSSEPEYSKNKVSTLFPINKEAYPSTEAVSKELKKKVDENFLVYPLATVPLAGTELVLIYQGSTVKVVAVSNIGGSGGGSLEKRHDWVSPVSYCGTSPLGSLESSPVWTIYKIQVNLDGTTIVLSATGVAWTNRLTVIYS